MLAARCAWTILRADHAQMRQFLASIAEAQQAVRWSKPEPALTHLRQQIELLQSFDLESHRPKGVSLMEALRGRSPDADRLLTDLEHEREAEDALLVQALGMLDAAAGGDESAGSACAALLERHRESVLHHLDQEDTLLCAHTEELLTEDEWSLVVSAISSVLYAEKPESSGAGSGEGLPK